MRPWTETDASGSAPRWSATWPGWRKIRCPARPQRLPLRLIGDGVTARHQDNIEGQATLHSRESLAAAAAIGEPALDEVRFRSNIVIEGVKAWEEHDWLGRRIRVGDELSLS